MYVAVGVASGAAAYLFGMSISLSIAIGFVAPSLLAATPRFLLATVKGAFTPGPREATAESAMSGMEFEDHVARIARGCGVPVIMTAVTGDWGVDLIVGNRPDRACGAMQTAVPAGRRGRRAGGRRGRADARTARRPWSSPTTNSPLPHANSPNCTAANSSAASELPRLRSIDPRLTAPTPTAL